MVDVTPLTMVLIGRTGNGKSATGNTILGNKVFESKRSTSSITKSSELQTCMRKDGQIINVIDTPGLFDLSVGIEYITKEIMKCTELASNGIHAVLLVFSGKNRFSQEEEGTVKVLQNIFGVKIVDYAIVVFTGGDEFDDDEDGTFEDYLRDFPVALKDILAACKNRFLLFDNKTKNETKNAEQVNKLLAMVNEVIAQNGGRPFTHRLLQDLKHEEKLKEIETKLDAMIKEKTEAMRKEEAKFQEMQKQWTNEMRNQKDMLANQMRNQEEMKKQLNNQMQNQLEMQRNFNEQMRNHNDKLTRSMERPPVRVAERSGSSCTIV